MSTADSITTTLAFTPDNPCNTKITAENGDTVYVVYTETGKQASTTRVFDVSDAVVASLTWKDTGFRQRDEVTVHERPLPLIKSLIPFNSDVSFKDESGRQYKWKGNEPGRALELYSAEDSFKQPIAQFRKSYLDRKTDPHTIVQARLIMTYRAEEIRDLVVASFLLLERGRRVNERSVTNRADGLAAGRIGAGSTSR